MTLGTPAHTCHAMRCDVQVPPRMFMCRKHWFMLPKAMRDRVWELYVPGQERRKDPTSEYIDHAMACVNFIAEKEAAA